jgi:Protein of unknown function/AsmA-like C-terminal region
MRKRAAKAGLIVIEVAAIAIAVIAAGGAFLFWRLESGPVSLSIFKPSIELAVQARLPEGYRCAVDTIKLARQEGKGAYVVRVSGIQIIDDEAKEAASASEVGLTFALGDFFSGEAGPRTIVASGVKFRVVRNAEQNVKLPAVSSSTARKSPIARLSSLLDRNIFNNAFENAEMSDAEITFVDIASGRSWMTRDASITIKKQTDGLSATIGGAIDIGGAPASIAVEADYSENSGVITLDIDGANFPIGDILSMFYGDRAAIIDAPVSGAAVISLTSSGDVLASSFVARLEGGKLRLGPTPTPVKFIEWESQFDPAKNEFVIERFAFDVNGSSGELNGAVNLQFGDDVRNPEWVGFDLEGEALTLNVPSRMRAPLLIDKAAVSGGYHVVDRRIDLSDIALSLLDVSAGGNFSMSFPRADESGAKPSPGVDASIKIDGALDPERLLKLWPLGMAMGARDWVEDRMEAAVIENINAEMALAEGAVVKGRPVPDEALTVSFDVHGAKAYFVKQMTPLTAGIGSGVLRGNSFLLKATSANVGAVAISEAEVEFPVFTPKWQPTYIRFLATGKSEDLLGVLDQEPMLLMSKINLDPDQFHGDARARIEIMRPNKRDVPTEDYRYSGLATFETMRITGITGDAELTDAKGRVDLKPRSVTITAKARLSEAPIDIVWRQNFFAADGPSSFSIAGTVDSSTGDLFGISSRQYIRGPVTFTANALGKIGNFETLEATADFGNAVLRIDALDWRKPAGAPAVGTISAKFSDGGFDIEKIELNGDGAAIFGSLQFKDGALASAAFPLFELKDAASLNLSAERKPTGEFAVTAIGDFLLAGPLLEQMVGGGSGGGGASDDSAAVNWGPGLVLTARIDKMRMRENVDYNNVSLDLWRDATKLQALDLTAFSADGAPLKVMLSHTGEDEGPGQSVEARTSALGEMLRAVFGYKSISGGEGSMQIGFAAPGRKGLFGVIEAKNLHVVDTPLLARLFSAGSFEGLADLLNGAGIDLDNVYGEFDLTDNVLSIDKFRASGSSVGFTAAGDIEIYDGGAVRLNGAVAPIYQINSVLGRTPIIGDLFVGKKGEGILALSYRITGERAAPDVFVNPLSALTPGIFRNLFEPLQPANDNTPITQSEQTPDEVDDPLLEDANPSQ